MLGEIKVYKTTFAPLTKTADDGSTQPCLFTMVRMPTSHVYLAPMLSLAGDLPRPTPPPIQTETVIIVHPDRWDAFWMAINQPNVFAHPEVRALLLAARTPVATAAGQTGR